MSQIETLRVSTTIPADKHEVTDIQQTIQGLFLSIQLSNPDHDIDWATVDILTDKDEVECPTFADPKWEILEIKRIYVTVEGVKR